MSRVVVLAMFSSLTLLAVSVLVPAAIAQSRAVSGPNGTGFLSAGASGAGSTDVQSLLIGGQFFAPLGASHGAALSLAAGPGFGSSSTEGAVSARLGLFWRNPASGVAGLFGGTTYVAGVTGWDVGLAGSAYAGNWDVGGSVGVAGFSQGFGSSVGGVFGVNAGWFASDQIRLGLGVDLSTDGAYGALASMRWQPLSTTSRFSVQAQVGGGSASGTGFYSVGAAVVIQLGDRKSLKQQLREDRL